MATYRPDPVAYLTGKVDEGLLPKAVSSDLRRAKFDVNGKVQPFPGNTFICHIDKQSDAFQYLRELQLRLMAGPHAHHFTFMPPASFHMTIMAGVSGSPPKVSTLPKGVTQSVPLKVMTSMIEAELPSVVVPDRYIMRCSDLFAGHSLTLDGDTNHEIANLAAARESLRNATGISELDFSVYTFHVTLAYVIRWLDEVAAREVVALGDDLFSEFRAKCPVIEIGPVEFCTFDDMYEFTTKGYIGSHGYEKVQRRRTK